MIRKKFKNPWLISTGSGILAVLGIRLIDFIAGTKILTTILNGILWVFRVLVGFFSQKFEVSLIFLISLPIIVIAIILFILWFISKLQDNNSDNAQPQISFLNYTQDVFNGVLFRWEYGKHYSGKFQIENISIYCPECKCSIVYGSCPVCKKYYADRRKDDVEIEALIRHRIENKN